MTSDADSGWTLVAQDEYAPDLIATVLDLDPETEYTRSEIADRADVPLKTLYLEETLERLADAGLLDRVDGDDSEATFVVHEGAPVLAAAREFDEAVAGQLRDETQLE